MGAAKVNVGSGVGVSGAGVDVGSPAGTVSVGTGVFVIVGVKITTDVRVGTGVASGTSRGATIEMRATATVPQTPINAAMIVGSILALFRSVICIPIH